MPNALGLGIDLDDAIVEERIERDQDGRASAGTLFAGTIMTHIGPEAAGTGAGAETSRRSSELKRAWLASHRRTIRRRCSRCRRREASLAWARLAICLAGVAPWFLFGQLRLPAAVITGTFAGLFIFVVGRHHRVRDRRDFLERLLLMIEESLQRCGGQVTLVRSWRRPVSPADSPASLLPILEAGRTWALTEQERDDLDVYAPPIGIFGLLNRTSCVLGARRLADMIDRPFLSAERITSRQESIRWVDGHPNQRLAMMAAAAGLRDQDKYLDKLVEAICKAAPLPRPIASLLIRGWSLFSGLFFVTASAFAFVGQYAWMLPLLAVLAFNGIVFGRMRRRLKTALAPWRDIQPTLTRLVLAVRQAASDVPDLTELKQLRECCAAAAGHAALPSLRRRQAWTDTGGPVRALLNVVLFYDLHVAEAILARVLPSRDVLLRGLSALADAEALCSLGCFAWEQPVACYPIPRADAGVSITAGRHPLIRPDRVVPNDVRLTGDTRMWVVTGPNAAGKSTLLRMVGINTLLGQMGAVAVAEEMTWSPIRLVTDLRVRDNLSKEESYFVSEVRHLRRMVFPPGDDAPVLGLIDEPFRGTNSREKCAASVALVEHLCASGDFFVVATHDDVLTKVAAEAPGAENHHFREELEALGIAFDYLLRPAPATTSTALKILEREGYPPALLDRARKWVADSGE